MRRRAAGFTLIELMAALVVIGLSLSIVLYGSEAMLPKEQLRSASNRLSSAILKARNEARIRREPIVFAYDFDRRGYEAYLPYERDDRGENVGPGKTPLIDFTAMSGPLGLKVASFRAVRLLTGEQLEEGVVELTIDTHGTMPSHDVILHNADYPEIEVYTVRVAGMDPRPTVLSGDVPREIPTDADFL